jgi:hypothetical protein
VLLCAQVIESGTINAVAFWFDLHLDAHESLTTGAPAACILHTARREATARSYRTVSYLTTAAQFTSQLRRPIVNKSHIKMPYETPN